MPTDPFALYRLRDSPALDDTADDVDFDLLGTTAANNPRGITILGPPPFATAVSH